MSQMLFIFRKHVYLEQTLQLSIKNAENEVKKRIYQVLQRLGNYIFDPTISLDKSLQSVRPTRRDLRS